VSVFTFKIGVTALLLFLLISCGDIPRDNPLDPKNSDSYTQPVVLLEAFVNYACPGDYSRWAVQSLKAIEQTYPGRVLVAEYHRNLTNSDYDDPYATKQTSPKFTQIQDSYISDGGVPIGVPDVFVNGGLKRVSGASSASSVQDEILPFINDLLTQKNYFMLQPQVSLAVGTDTTCQVNCRFARLGNKASNDLKIRLIFIKDEGLDLLRHRVLDVSLPQALETLNAGGYTDVKFEPVALADIPTSVVVSLLDSDGKTVIQAVEEVLK